MTPRISLFVLIAVLCGACSVAPSASGPGLDAEGNPLLEPSALSVGQCFDAEPEDDIVAGVTVRECTEAHKYELFALAYVPVASTAPYPGFEALRTEAFQQCVPRLEVYADVWAADYLYDFGFFYPSEQSWAEDGDRRIACYLYDYDEQPLTASVRVIPPPARVHHRDLDAGACFDAPETEFVYTVPIVSCDAAHDYETFGGFAYTVDGDTYPEPEVFEQAVAEQCLPLLATYAGDRVSQPDLTYSYYYPTAENWAAGDRRVVCFAHLESGQLVGSIAGR